jgi:ABC-type sugar transport system substrate-binding protein
MPPAIRTSFSLITAATALMFPLLTSPTTASAKAVGAKVVILTVSQECEYCAMHLRSFLEAAKAGGLNVDVKINNYDPATQATQVDQAIAQKPDAIVLWPADASALVPSIRKIKNANIPLVISNSMPDKKYAKYWDAYTGPNDEELGEHAALALIQGFQEKGLGVNGSIFVIEGVPGTPPQIQRLEGFKKILSEKAPEIKILGIQPGNWDQSKATEAAAPLFTQYRDVVKGVYAQADNMCAGVIVAAQRAGLDPSKLVLVGGNFMPEGLKAISDGTMYGSVEQSPIEDGKYAAQAVIELLDGKKAEAIRYLPNPIITKKNVAEYAESAQW